MIQTLKAVNASVPTASVGAVKHLTFFNSLIGRGVLIHHVAFQIVMPICHIFTTPLKAVVHRGRSFFGWTTVFTRKQVDLAEMRSRINQR